MMSTWQKAPNVFNFFKWQRTEPSSSLTTGLLDNASHEIELSNYGGVIPSPGSESPSGLLNGESLTVQPITDLDLFFERLYSYYRYKGLWCIIVKWAVELLSLGFIICFSGFFLLYVDWRGLKDAKCGMDAVESWTKPCDLVKEAIHEHPLSPFTLTTAIIVGYLALFFIYWLFCFLRFFAQLKDTLDFSHFYYNSLHVTDNEILTMPWETVLENFVQLQSSQRLCWTLNWFILQSMFDCNFRVRRDFVSNPTMLKKQLFAVGVAMLMLSSYLVIFMLVYLFLRHAEQFYNHPSTASSRRWSNLSRWLFREFNEVDHLFKYRINNSAEHASEYLNQISSGGSYMRSQFIMNLLWYAAVFGTITAISRAAVSDEILVLDPVKTMTFVVQHTHYMPKRWRGKENKDDVRLELKTLFQYTGMMLLEEMASIFITPFLLMFVVPKRVDDILQFIRNFTVDIEGVGNVYSFNAFDSRTMGILNMGKMEKSFLSFQSSFPTWESNSLEKQFLSNLRTFRDQKLPEINTRHSSSPTRPPHETSTSSTTLG
ncbi:BnaA05g11540D [Brassica napus]|uniref:Autophagy-related protein 9 n=1 Tax=Brassica napus TaxID=3708 RepID=A0A078FCQ8_BRANA|nr:BnaA05g11540D [Brassica napus]